MCGYVTYVFPPNGRDPLETKAVKIFYMMLGFICIQRSEIGSIDAFGDACLMPGLKQPVTCNQIAQMGS